MTSSSFSSSSATRFSSSAMRSLSVLMRPSAIGIFDHRIYCSVEKTWIPQGYARSQERALGITAPAAAGERAWWTFDFCRSLPARAREGSARRLQGRRRGRSRRDPSPGRGRGGRFLAKQLLSPITMPSRGMSLVGTFETCQPTLTMSVHRGRPEVADRLPKRRF
jgi:hypothetical protein